MKRRDKSLSFPLQQMKRQLVIVAILSGAVTLTGCGTACGPVRTVPSQRLSIVATAPNNYVIHVKPPDGTPIETPVPVDGRVTFAVPVTSREATIFFFGVPVYHYPSADAMRVIRLLREGRTIRKLSAQDIARLPADPDGYHVLIIEK